MIKQSDLVNRMAINGVCVDFDYFLNIENGPRVRCRFSRDKSDLKMWCMCIVLERTRDADSQVYSFNYQLPKDNMDLTMVAAIGLKYFQLHLREEIQLKSNIEFCLSEVTANMVG